MWSSEVMALQMASQLSWASGGIPSCTVMQWIWVCRQTNSAPHHSRQGCMDAEGGRGRVGGREDSECMCVHQTATLHYQNDIELPHHQIPCHSTKDPNMPHIKLLLSHSHNH